VRLASLSQDMLQVGRIALQCNRFSIAPIQMHWRYPLAAQEPDLLAKQLAATSLQLNLIHGFLLRDFRLRVSSLKLESRLSAASFQMP